MTEQKIDINITKQKKLIIIKIEKYKKLNSNSMTEHRTDINITKQKKLFIIKIEKYK